MTVCVLPHYVEYLFEGDSYSSLFMPFASHTSIAVVVTVVTLFGALYALGTFLLAGDDVRSLLMILMIAAGLKLLFLDCRDVGEEDGEVESAKEIFGDEDEEDFLDDLCVDEEVERMEELVDVVEAVEVLLEVEEEREGFRESCSAM